MACDESLRIQVDRLAEIKRMIEQLRQEQSELEAVLLLRGQADLRDTKFKSVTYGGTSGKATVTIRTPVRLLYCSCTLIISATCTSTQSFTRFDKIVTAVEFSRCIRTVNRYTHQRHYTYDTLGETRQTANLYTTSGSTSMAHSANFARPSISTPTSGTTPITLRQSSPDHQTLHPPTALHL